MKRSDISTLTVLQAAERAHAERGMMTWEYILQETGAPEKVIYAAMEREVDRDFLEWGVSLRTAWLADKGKSKLSDLRKEGL